MWVRRILGLRRTPTPFLLPPQGLPAVSSSGLTFYILSSHIQQFKNLSSFDLKQGWMGNSSLQNVQSYVPKLPVFLHLFNSNNSENCKVKKSPLTPTLFQFILQIEICWHRDFPCSPVSKTSCYQCKDLLI